MYELHIVREDEYFWTMDKIELPNIPGVYFIYDSKKELIYIGQTKNLLTRTVNHFSADLWFKLFAQYISYIEVDIDSLRIVESERIKEFRPKYNIERYNGISDGEMKDAICNRRII
jgi:excinuclease UvrABC nuclease subunit